MLARLIIFVIVYAPPHSANYTNTTLCSTLRKQLYAVVVVRSCFLKCGRKAISLDAGVHAASKRSLACSGKRSVSDLRVDSSTTRLINVEVRQSHFLYEEELMRVLGDIANVQILALVTFIDVQYKVTHENTL